MVAYVGRFAIGALVVLILVTLFHELGHAGMHRAQGYRGPWRIYTGPEAWRQGWIAGYESQGGPDPAGHHATLTPATIALGLLGAVLVTWWAARAQPS